MTFAVSQAASEVADTRSVAWGDMDGDGDLDLAVGNWNQTNWVYLNAGDGTLTLIWASSSPSTTRSVAWGDMDGDGDLDLAVGNADQPSQVYQNLGAGKFALHWQAPAAVQTRSVAWGDMDGDGDLDLAVGNQGHQDQVYRNDGNNTFSLSWLSPHVYDTRSVAWGHMDGDGRLDIAFGYWGAANQVYRNEGGGVFGSPWSAPVVEETRSAAWGDMDGDGDLDLAVGNDGKPTRIYRNAGGASFETFWSTSTTFAVHSVAWADADQDGDLDLAVAHSNTVNQIYRNDGGTFVVGWQATTPSTTRSVAWGDMDGDGDLDLAVGNGDNPNQLYLNLSDTAFPISDLLADPQPIHSLAWGDMDGDGDLDLAVGNNGQANRVYRNDGTGQLMLLWTAPGTYMTRSVAWGDVDGDGDLDLAVGNDGQVNRLYRYDGTNGFEQIWTATHPLPTYSIAWGDAEGDGDLDLVVGNRGEPNELYRNDGNGLLARAWVADKAATTRSVAWGDMDGDGDLDLAVGNESDPNEIYRNDGDGNLHQTWQAATESGTYHLAWGDMDGDGDLDLASANWGEPNEVHQNIGDGTFHSVWRTLESDTSRSVAWGDMDGDGDLDLAMGKQDQPNQIYRNLGDSTFTLAWSAENTAATYSIAWSDIDNDGDSDLTIGNADTSSQIVHNFYQGGATLPDNPPTLRVRQPDTALLTHHTIPITYTLFDPEAQPVGRLAVWYSLDGGGHWLPAVATADTPLTHLATEPFPTTNSTNTHVFIWDTFASGVFGRAEQAVLRFVVYPQVADGATAGSYQYRSHASGPFLRATTSAQTLPFRVRGSQIRVLDNNGSPVEHALVQHRIGPEGTYQLYRDSFGQPFRTNTAGYLAGRGQLALGDRLVAFSPITASTHYTLYHTNAVPTEDGVMSYEVTQPGLQPLGVSSEYPLLLFNLKISLQWDVRRNPTYLAQLEQQLQRASQVLYDATNGQVALGHLDVYQAGEAWQESDLLVYATNALRPSADLGGVVEVPLSETLSNTQVIPNAYVPGQLRMGAIWNRFGMPTDNLGEDWALALAHELGHYLLFLPDNYLGLSSHGVVTLVDCPGSLMTNPYYTTYSELLSPSMWGGECDATLAQHTTGRSDWETVSTFYPALNGTLANTGPATLPLEVTEIAWVEPTAPPTTLTVPYFEMVDSLGKRLPLSGSHVQGYVFKGRETEDERDDWLLPVGSPHEGRLLARGASIGERLCILVAAMPSRQGCLDSLQPSSSQVVIYETPNWDPSILVTPQTSTTIEIEVRQTVSSGTVLAQLLPASPSPLTSASPVVPLTQVSPGVFVQSLTMETPIREGFIRVWVPDLQPAAESIVEFALNQGWGPRTKHGWGFAPIASTDGQVTIFGLSFLFGGAPAYSLQAVSGLGDLPAWLTAVGRIYRFSSHDDLQGPHSILFRYLDREMPTLGDENSLHIYYSPVEGQPWRRLATELDPTTNMAAAQIQGEGRYVLISTVDVPPFSQGWNNFGYPLVVGGNHPITVGLASVAGSYTSVYRRQNGDPTQWTLYDSTVVADHPEFVGLVNDLHRLISNEAYWLYATEPITLHVSPSLVVGAGLPSQMAGAAIPATFYGWVLSTPSFTPTVGMSIVARIDGTICGETEVQEWLGQLAYKLQVGCGPFLGYPTARELAGATIILEIDGQQMDATPWWDNRQAWFLPLARGQLAHSLYLPWVTKN